MSYQVLARKWRPKSFDQLVGQQQTAQALINALDSKRLHHAYLFTGTRGVGKTTIARIFSKSVNCEQGISATPCNQCAACEAIDQGNFVDLLEIDAASKTKVDDTREMLENVQYRPTRGRYKVYLIDEVHMLSNHSFNALLKTLEEPPPHVIFLLATTDPQKLPVTVLSRCLQFHLRRMEEAEINAHLAKVLTAEQISFADEALALIARSADGSMRDALSILDQAIVFGSGEVGAQSTRDMLGAIDGKQLYALLEAMAEGDAARALEAVDSAASFAPDYANLLADWLHLLHQLATAKALGQFQDQEQEQLAQRLSGADLQLFYQLSLQCRRDLAAAPNSRQAFEMMVLRCLAFRPLEMGGLPGGAKKKELSKEPPASSEVVKNRQQQQSVSSQIGATARSAVETKSAADTSPAKQGSDTQPQTKLVENNAADVGHVEAEQMDDTQPVQDVEQINPQNWHQLVSALDIQGQGLQILMHSLGHYVDGRLRIELASDKSILLTDSIQLALIQCLREYFQSPALNIEFTVGELQSETPRQRKDRLMQEAIAKAKAELLANPQIQYMMSHLECSLDESSIAIAEHNQCQTEISEQENR